MILYRLILFAGLFVLSVVTTHADDRLIREREAAFRYLNELRTQAGLPAFHSNSRLDQAAMSHARYISATLPAGHLQSPGHALFSGETPADRAFRSGYMSAVVTENFSVGQANARQSINGLMSAIYHRLAFLDFSKNELGIGIDTYQAGLSFVYLMGNNQLDRYCRAKTAGDRQVSDDPLCRADTPYDGIAAEELPPDTGRELPNFIVWPPEGERSVPTAFYEEIPDPLPDYRVSGYPVSVQVNPFRYEHVRFKQFRLFEHAADREVLPARQIKKELDPHQQFSTFQIALFPLNRLKWNTVYRAEIQFQADGRPIHKTWRFQTEKTAHPVFVIQGQDEILKLLSGRPYLIHVPARRDLPYIRELRWESMSGMTTDVSWLDRNTIRVRLAGALCETARFYFNGGRSFTLQISNKDNLNKTHQYQQGLPTACLEDFLKAAPGFRITGRGEVIEVRPDQDFWVRIRQRRDLLSDISWELQRDMEVHVTRLDQDLLRIRLHGIPDQAATFFLSNAGMFKVVLVE